jgi:hypothetical protein
MKLAHTHAPLYTDDLGVFLDGYHSPWSLPSVSGYFPFKLFLYTDRNAGNRPSRMRGPLLMKSISKPQNPTTYTLIFSLLYHAGKP